MRFTLAPQPLQESKYLMPSESKQNRPEMTAERETIWALRGSFNLQNLSSNSGCDDCRRRRRKIQHSGAASALEWQRWAGFWNSVTPLEVMLFQLKSAEIASLNEAVSPQLTSLHSAPIGIYIFPPVLVFGWQISCYSIPYPKYPLLWHPLPEISLYNIPCPNYSIFYYKYHAIAPLISNILFYGIPYSKDPIIASLTSNVPCYSIPYPKSLFIAFLIQNIPFYGISCPNIPL